MKNLISTFIVLVCGLTITSIAMAQNTILVAPSDVVVSREYQFNLNDLSDLSNATFGKLVDAISERGQIITYDVVCDRFCLKVPCIGFEGFISGNPLPKPASNLACDYFIQYFDSLQINTKYNLDWGMDGYYLNAGLNLPWLTVIDNRILTQDRKSKFGAVLRIYNIFDQNNEVLADTQIIWVVDCNYNPKINRALSCFDDISVYLDSSCCVTITSDLILAGIGPYDCWDSYKVEARSWITNAKIDRDSLMPGIQLKYEDIGKDFKFTVYDPLTGNSCWGHGLLLDTIKPKIIYPDTVNVSAESFSCNGRWMVPRPTIMDCSNDNFSYKVRSLDGDVLGNEVDGYIVINLALGFQSAEIILTDPSGNSARKKVVLKVEDTSPPISVCKTSTVVSISGVQNPNGNFTKVFASSLDEGSFDNCQPKVWFKAIRMDELLGTTSGSNSNNSLICKGINGDDDAVISENQVYFDDFTNFCCADVGRRIKVVLRVFDVDPGSGPVAPSEMKTSTGFLFGRFSECISEILVQDKSTPTVVAPPDIVISCAFPFGYNNLIDPNDNTFGRVLNTVSGREKVITRDKVCQKFCVQNTKTGYPGYKVTTQMPEPAPNKACSYFSSLYDSTEVEQRFELEWGLDGYVVNACGTTPSITVNDLRECGQGKVQRIISAGGIRSIQTIWVVDCDPFYIDTLHCNDSTYSDVIWPNGICGQTEIVFNGSYKNLSPDSLELGRPIIVNNADDNCALISIQYVDSIIQIKTDTTIKVFRKWIVTDWCQYDSLVDPNFGRWTTIQKIHANGCGGSEINPLKDTCGVVNYDTKLKLCLGHINLLADVQDFCTELENLIWTYKIDLNNDGRGIYNGYDFQVGPLSIHQYQNGDTAKFSHNPFADNNKSPFSASGSYPVGTHKILWSITDKYGNVTNKEFIFNINDCISPIARCLTGVITVPMPSSGCITIWAKDLDNQSSDNCTLFENLKFYFNGDINKESITICCKDFIEAKAHDELIINVEMWVEDEGRNTDSCHREITIQDNQDICPNVVGNKDIKDDNSLFIFPNPSNGTIFVSSKVDIDQINVISFTGIQYSSYKVRDHNTLTIGDLPSGLYFIESIKDGKKLKSKRAIVFN